MARFLVVVGNYYPQPSSVVAVAGTLLRWLATHGHEVEVLTDRTSPEVPEHEVIDGINVYRVDDPRILTSKRANARTRAASGWRKRAWRGVGLVQKAAAYARWSVFTREMVTGGWSRSKTVRLALERDAAKPFDAVISISQPYLSHYIAEEFLDRVGRPVHWFMHYFDPFSENRNGIRTPWKRAWIRRDELRMLARCDRAFMTPELIDFLSAGPLAAQADKFTAIEYASLVDHTAGQDAAPLDGPLECFFAGTFYPTLRSPDHMLAVFGAAHDGTRLQLMTDYFSPAARAALPANVQVTDMRPQDQMWDALRQAHVLVSVGNTVSYQTPGKIFEYLGTGKPIVHFRKIEDDPVLPYLAGHPHVLVIDERAADVAGDARRLAAFLAEHGRSRLDWGEVLDVAGRFASDAVCRRYQDEIEASLGTLLNA